MPRRSTPELTTCHLLRADPELALGISPARKVQAENACVGQALNVRPGRWNQATGDVEDGMGLLVLDGLLLRRVNVEGRFGAELLGKGDVIRPWQDATEPVLRRATTWRVLQASRLAVLDDRVLEQLAHYPQIIRRLLERTMERSRRLAVNMAIVHHPRVEIRLQMLFWHLADRWGHACDGGTLLPVRLTHSVLADLVAAQRPTVSTALSELACREIVRPMPEGWLLLAAPPQELLGSRNGTHGAPG